MACGKRIVFFLSLLFVFFIEGSATEKQPWAGNPFEFEARGSAWFQSYRNIASGSHLEKYPSNDLFLNLSLKNYTLIPIPLDIELEALEAFTRKQGGNLDSLKVTAISPYLDDIGGDPISIQFGVSYIQAFRQSLEDLSSFHHGLYNGELFISLGKEKPKDTFWQRRGWAVLGIGMAERGSAWGRIDVHADFTPHEGHELKFFMCSLWGMGQKTLHIDSFKGYGDIAHSSIDIGVGYTYHIDYVGEASVEYMIRPYAVNFPAYTQQLLLRFMYSFGL